MTFRAGQKITFRGADGRPCTGLLMAWWGPKEGQGYSLTVKVEVGAGTRTALLRTPSPTARFSDIQEVRR